MNIRRRGKVGHPACLGRAHRRLGRDSRSRAQSALNTLSQQLPLTTASSLGVLVTGWMSPSKRKRTESNDGSPDEVCASSQASPPPIVRVPLDRKAKKRARNTIAVESQQVGEITTPHARCALNFISGHWLWPKLRVGKS